MPASASTPSATDRVRVRLRDRRRPPRSADVEGRVAVACDGIHSAVRKQLYPDEGPPRWSGVNMWRGVTPHAPFLSGATMVRAGWLSVGKMVIYPIRNDIDGAGRQLVNWVAELECAEPVRRDWNARGSLDDFFPTFADWRFDWLDVAALIRSTETVLAYPMVDQDPLPRWSFGRVTLLGDAAHPMVPRGSNGAGQAILDARCLADELAAHGVGPKRSPHTTAVRNAATAKVVLANRSTPPDAILREVHERSGDKPFARIEDVVSREELARIADNYKQVAGHARRPERPSAPRRGDRLDSISSAAPPPRSSPRSSPARSPRWAAGRALAQAAWPGKPVRIVVPYTPGTGMDILARTLARTWARRSGARRSSSTTGPARRATSAPARSPSRRPTA